MKCSVAIVSLMLLANGCGGELTRSEQIAADRSAVFAMCAGDRGSLDFAVVPATGGPNSLTLAINDGTDVWRTTSAGDGIQGVVRSGAQVAYLGCLRPGDRGPSFDCTYFGTTGDGVPDVHVVRYHDTTFSLEIRDATSGEVVATESVASTGDGTCTANYIPPERSGLEERFVAPTSDALRSVVERWTNP